MKGTLVGGGGENTSEPQFDEDGRGGLGRGTLLKLEGVAVAVPVKELSVEKSVPVNEVNSQSITEASSSGVALGPKVKSGICPKEGSNAS